MKITPTAQLDMLKKGRIAASHEIGELISKACSNPATPILIFMEDGRVALVPSDFSKTKPRATILEAGKPPESESPFVLSVEAEMWGSVWVVEGSTVGTDTTKPSWNWNSGGINTDLKMLLDAATSEPILAEAVKLANDPYVKNPANFNPFE